VAEHRKYINRVDDQISELAAAILGFEGFQKIGPGTLAVVFMCRYTRTGFPAIVKTATKSLDTAERKLD
jgi:hypothetical protein